VIKRILALLVIAAVAGVGSFAVVVFGADFKLTIGSTSKDISATVKAKDLQLICPGGVYRTGGVGGTKVGSFDQLPTANVLATWSGAQGTQLKLNGVSDGNGSRVTVPFETTAAATLQVDDVAGNATQGSTLLTANQVQLIKSESINGLAAAPCQRPSTDAWLLGGSVATGRETLLVLTNSSPVDATVNLELFSNLGQIKTSALSGISVSASTTKVLPLASYVSKAETVALHVQSQGGSVASWLQVKSVRGLTAAGADWVSPSQDFSTEPVIAGVFIRGSAAAQTLIASNPDYADLKPVLRLFAPLSTGDAAGKPVAFNAQLIGSNDQTFGTVIQDQLTPGTAIDFNLDGLADGDYSAFIRADQPILASIKLVRTNPKAQPNTDFTWLSASDNIQGARVFVTPASGINKLALANAGAVAVVVKLVNLQTSMVTELTVPANSNLSFTLANQAAMSIEASAAVQASIILDQNGSLANLQITDYRNLGGQVLVSIR